jgi:hypothetical protein
MEQSELLRHTVQALEGLEIHYALVGSYGSSIFGEPRFTRDIDILIDLPESKVSAFCSSFPAPDFYLNEDAVRGCRNGRRPRQSTWSGDPVINSDHCCRNQAKLLFPEKKLSRSGFNSALLK